ncbi:hypothetical protein QP027_11275 [Corynebacterium breve]|uniref:Lipoprotein n=1 Tax=Corynebacterium breve TaxID=3049799 RepID=A0ABY8VDV1_9CORY|nr:hypothetical protein [Corynebacterium breve]WIM67649.1 hypothetical protein QP027_11275 [Corynebacterium breve]
MKRLLSLATAVLLSAGLYACTPAKSFHIQPELTTPSTTSSAPTIAEKLYKKGDLIEVPCSETDDNTCMTVRLVDIDPNARCVTPDGIAAPRFVSLHLNATMPQSADSTFVSPFDSNPWMESTAGQLGPAVESIDCQGGENIVQLMKEFPGKSVEGHAFIAVPVNSDAVLFRISTNEYVKIDISAPADK